jgi:hypothetical protein
MLMALTQILLMFLATEKSYSQSIMFDRCLFSSTVQMKINVYIAVVLVGNAKQYQTNGFTSAKGDVHRDK